MTEPKKLKGTYSKLSNHALAILDQVPNIRLVGNKDFKHLLISNSMDLVDKIDLFR
jgi:hypothetical protein